MRGAPSGLLLGLLGGGWKADLPADCRKHNSYKLLGIHALGDIGGGRGGFGGPSVDPLKPVPMISPPKREAPQRRGHQQPSNGVSDGLLSCRVPTVSGLSSLKIRVTLECLESEVDPLGGPPVFKTKIKLVSKLQLKGLILAQNER